MRLRSWWWWPVALGYGAWRVGELVASRRNERRLDERGLGRQADRGYPWMLAAHGAVFGGGAMEVASGASPAPRALVGACAGALAAAAALRVWVQRTLGARWNVHVHAGPEMGIATKGPYEFVRHPNYLAVIVEVAALPLAGGAWRTALIASVLNGIALARRIPDEERALASNPAWVREMAPKPRLLPSFTAG